MTSHQLFCQTSARFEIHNVFRTDLAAGRARAIVPPTARGFTVVTRGVAYEDVGTEFGLSVEGATGSSQMHVFDGQVNLRRGDVAGPLLRRAFAGDSVGFRDGQVVEVPEMEIEIPGEHPELTVAVWLKVDRFEREFSAILNSNGAEEGGYHLQMNRHGLPRGGLLGVERANQRWVGHPVPTGKWVHVVSVLSVTQRRHVIYVNGLPVLESELAALTESGRPSLLWSRANPPLMEPMPAL